MDSDAQGCAQAAAGGPWSQECPREAGGTEGTGRCLKKSVAVLSVLQESSCPAAPLYVPQEQSPALGVPRVRASPRKRSALIPSQRVTGEPQGPPLPGTRLRSNAVLTWPGTPGCRCPAARPSGFPSPGPCPVRTARTDPRTASPPPR